MSLVLDASVTLAWYFPDESLTAADAVLDLVAQNGALVPGLWRWEIANALQAALRRGRIDKAGQDAALEDLRVLPIRVDADSEHHAWGGTLRLASQFGLSCYDAAYLELAARMRQPLASLDQRLLAAADTLGVARAIRPTAPDH